MIYVLTILIGLASIGINGMTIYYAHRMGVALRRLDAIQAERHEWAMTHR